MREGRGHVVRAAECVSHGSRKGDCLREEGDQTGVGMKG